ncbi:MAG: hypothetical protein NVS9B3_13010 [Gemmatimonadaceae bacterium]
MQRLAVGFALCASGLLGTTRPATAQSRTPRAPISGKGSVPHTLAIGPLTMMSASALSTSDSIVALVRAQVGKKYVFGGGSPERGFDCSGLVQYVMSLVDVHLPRTAKAQSLTGVAVPRDTTRLRPGDLLTFGRGKVSHIGIYVGDGRFVHASTAAKRVIEVKLDRPRHPKIKPWHGVRRLVFTDTAAVVTGS